MREVVKHLPNENLIYFGDTANLPYGDKSPQAVLRYTSENVSFLIDQGIKLLIVACFTASSHALDVLEQKLSIPVISVIQGGLEELLKATLKKRVAVIGTTGTIKSGILQSLIQQREPSTVVFPIACPLFVPLIEEGLIDHSATRLIASHYLDDLKDKNIDSALLACTHYPLIRPILQDSIGPDVRLIEPATSCALKSKSWLQNHGMLNQQKTNPTYEYYVSDHSDKFSRLANRFFGFGIQEVKKFRIEKK